MKNALTVPVEPFKFSSRQGGVAYELSYPGYWLEHDSQVSERY